MEAENKGKIKRIKIGGIVVLIFILIYIPSLIHWAGGVNIKTGIIRTGSIEDSVNTEAFIVRDEEVITSSYNGTYIPTIGEGEKLASNASIATVLKDSSEELLQDLKENDLKIIQAQKEKNTNAEIFSDDVTKLDDEIKDEMNQLMALGNNNSLDKLKQIRNDMNSKLQKKAEIIGDTGPADKYITSLKQSKQNLESKIKQQTSDIICHKSGIISFVIDGYENVLKPSAIKTLSPKSLEEMRVKGKNTTSNTSVQAGKAFAKIIKSQEYSIAAVLTNDEAKGFKVGDIIAVRLNDINKTVNGEVEYISDSTGGKAIVSVKANKCANDLSSFREINVDLVKKDFEGFIVPMSSLIEFDPVKKTAKIVMVESNYARIKPVKILVNNEEDAIISSIDNKKENIIKLYDIFITKPGNIKEGQLVIE